jgi:hypothetical protein
LSFRQHIQHTIPEALFNDTRACPRAQSVYLFLIGRRPESISNIAAGIGSSLDSARAAVAHLKSKGWVMDLRQPSARQRQIVTTWPVRVESEIAKSIRNDRWNVPYLGEWLMTCWLDYLVVSADYLDHSRPEWLRQTSTGHKMEFDREYKGLRTAFEFQGQQHFQTILMYPDPLALVEQQRRDNTKAGICARHGVRLVEVTAEDLNLRVMLQKVAWLPLRQYRQRGPIVSELTQIYDSYMGHLAKTQRQSESCD